MAAPSGIVWGSIVKDYGRIGIYTGLSNTDTTTTVTVEVWFWSKFSVTDYNNTFYFDNLASSGSATTSEGKKDIVTTSDSGGWSTTNQIRIARYTYNYTRGTSATTRYLYAALSSVDRVGAIMYASTTFSVPKLASYTVSYNANGGSGAPSSQSKLYGKSITISTTRPTRNGYAFQGWATSASGSVAYAPGASYTANASVTLYAVWKANTYTVTYNANGGSGAPSSQTKTHGVTLTLSSTKPTRPNYTFKGWGTSVSATTVAYAAGASYTANASVTLYAIWSLAYVKPRVTDVSVFRCDTDGVISDTGTYASVKFNWECDQDISSITIEWEALFVDPVSKSVTVEGTSGSVNEIVGDGSLSVESTYTFTMTITDASGYTVVFGTLDGTKFAIDFLYGGLGVAIGKPAELEGVFEVAFQTKLTGGILQPLLEPETDLNDIHTPNVYTGASTTAFNYVNCPLESGTFILTVEASGPAKQVRQELRRCHKTDGTVWERYYYSDTGNNEYAWGEWQERPVMTDSGWHTLTCGSEFKPYDDLSVNAVQYRRIGKIVEVRGIVAPTVEITGGTTMHTIATLPAGYYPNYHVHTICQGSGNCTWLLRVNYQNGKIEFSRYRNGNSNATIQAAGAWLPFQIMFFVG